MHQEGNKQIPEQMLRESVIRNSEINQNAINGAIGLLGLG